MQSLWNALKKFSAVSAISEVKSIGVFVMNKRRLGNSELELFPLVFGGNVFGWTVDEPTAFRILDAFV